MTTNNELPLFPISASQSSEMTRGIRPISFRKAVAFVNDHHSYLPAPRGCLFCVSAFEDDRITAVVIIGRPSSPQMDDGVTASITRLCCNEAPKNTASALIRRAVTACKALGYHRFITYVDGEKYGACFRSAMFQPKHTRKRVQWHGKDLCMDDRHSETTTLFEIVLPTYATALKAIGNPAPSIAASRLPRN